MKITKLEEKGTNMSAVYGIQDKIYIYKIWHENKKMWVVNKSKNVFNLNNVEFCISFNHAKSIAKMIEECSLYVREESKFAKWYIGY